MIASVAIGSWVTTTIGRRARRAFAAARGPGMPARHAEATDGSDSAPAVTSATSPIGDVLAVARLLA